MTRGAVQSQTPGMTEIKAYQQAELQKWTECFFIHPKQSRVAILFGTLNPQLMGPRGILKAEPTVDVLGWC